MATRIKGGAPGHLIIERAEYRNPGDIELAGEALFDFLWEHVNFSDIMPTVLRRIADVRDDLLKEALAYTLARRGISQ